MQARYLVESLSSVKVPYNKRFDYDKQPKFYADFEKVMFKVDRLQNDDDIKKKEQDDLILSLNYVLDKLEKLLLPQEFTLLLLRYSLIHLKYPESDSDTDVEKQQK